MYLFSFKYFQNVIKYLVLVFILKGDIESAKIRCNENTGKYCANCPLFSIASFKVFALSTIAIIVVVTLKEDSERFFVIVLKSQKFLS